MGIGAHVLASLDRKDHFLLRFAETDDQVDSDEISSKNMSRHSGPHPSNGPSGGDPQPPFPLAGQRVQGLRHRSQCLRGRLRPFHRFKRALFPDERRSDEDTDEKRRFFFELSNDVKGVFQGSRMGDHRDADAMDLILRFRSFNDLFERIEGPIHPDKGLCLWDFLSLTSIGRRTGTFRNIPPRNGGGGSIPSTLRSDEKILIETLMSERRLNWSVHIGGSPFAP